MNPTGGRQPADTEADVAATWRAHRSYLVGIAARVLHDRAAAEDVVQEAFSRFSDADREAIEDARGWLAVVVRRLSLDRIGSAYARRETVAGATTWAMMEPRLRGGSTGQDPVDQVTLDDQVRLALAVVLERMSPAERTSFVLHDVFEFPYEAVSEIVGRSPAACRQLASRARRAIRSERQPAGPDGDVDDKDVLTERFIAACSTGDLDGLLAILDPDVVGEAGLLGQEPIGRFVGAATVARRALIYFGPKTNRTLLPLSVAAEPCFVSLDADRVEALVRVALSAEGRIVDLRAILTAPI